MSSLFNYYAEGREVSTMHDLDQQRHRMSNDQCQQYHFHLANGPIGYYLRMDKPLIAGRPQWSTYEQGKPTCLGEAPQPKTQFKYDCKQPCWDRFCR